MSYRKWFFITHAHLRKVIPLPFSGRFGEPPKPDGVLQIPLMSRYDWKLFWGNLRAIRLRCGKLRIADCFKKQIEVIAGRKVGLTKPG